jgi:hypothetical protein
MKISSRSVGARLSTCGVVSFPLFSQDGFVVRFDVSNTSYTIYFTICRFVCET